MFDAVRNNQKIIQFVLALITLPFAFWGIDSYVRTGSAGNDVATVGNAHVSQSEYQQMLRDETERMRGIVGNRFDPAIFETAEAKQALLDQLIARKLVALNARKNLISIGDEQLAAYITSQPNLQENGKFSPQKYEMLVARTGMTKESFEAQARQDLAMNTAPRAVGNTTIVGKVAADRWVATQLEQRDVSDFLFSAEQLAASSKPTADAVKAYYEQNRAKFESPEQVRVQYVVFSPDVAAQQVTVKDEDIKAFYQANLKRFGEMEQRRASHILIGANKDAPAATISAAKSQAEEVYKAVLRSPGDFAALAKKHSNDPGSAGKGGDLDWFGRGMMVKPFEDAVYALKEGQVSAIVQTDFGFHIIKLTGIKPERVKSLDQVRGEIASELKQQAATKKFADSAEAFGNTVYEQSDSLKPAVEKFGVTVQTSDWLTKGGKAAPPFDNAKLFTALFSDDSIKNKRNTEAIEVASNTLVAARVAEHKPAQVKSLESVAPAIEHQLALEEAGKKAAAQGAEMLARLQKGEAVDVRWGPARKLSRVSARVAQGLPAESLKAVFEGSTDKLPAYAGAATPAGYVLFRINGVTPYAAGPTPTMESNQALQEYQRSVSGLEFAAWMASLRQAFPVEIHKDALDSGKQ